jgi:hypothetical protein
MRTYKLVGREPVPVGMVEWAMWFETADRAVAKSIVKDAEVSTVFLALDHGFGASRPVLFETMVFGGEFDQWQGRASTYEDALRIHNNVVDCLMNGQPLP